jgi:hypothetical protein
MTGSMSMVGPNGISLNRRQPKETLRHKWQASKFRNTK